jgi:mRNA-degrading endonuclease HigB of HigAB toxin-antitoxin module
MSGKLKKLLEEARHGMFFTAVGKNHWQWGVEGAKLRVLANVTYGIVWILVPVMKECADETSC